MKEGIAVTLRASEAAPRDQRKGVVHYKLVPSPWAYLSLAALSEKFSPPCPLFLSFVSGVSGPLLPTFCFLIHGSALLACKRASHFKSSQCTSSTVGEKLLCPVDPLGDRKLLGSTTFLSPNGLPSVYALCTALDRISYLPSSHAL